ncbi:galactose mutarotase [Haematobacter massiliensis]|uniref:Aldose 1-epimerase n=1 Tax=Haematobacter massiliensis TaxID=195105 RepID=A0A086Y8C3_9RHOB|nr:aldose epimerase family protein [Haematobacter massiliensis]KFI30523.1 aldose epimerase [Haematobacter massiliensis]OWJ73371.1 galactose mutarotase [Haematobacter massiliensis]OWJ82307.1 galactose mutarotase [Haematobacter massiliensis]QBJ24993.1 galactose mutarotase [Haematobacter massiliensis]
MTRRIFGTMPDGTQVEALTLRGGGLWAEVLTYGAVVRDLRLEGHAPPLVLGFETLEDYLGHSRNHGATCGRVANRIGNGRFSLEGRDHALELNEKGVTHSHGGSQGMAKRVWTVVEHGADRLTLSLHDPAGQAGYPGAVDSLCHMRLADGGLEITYESRVDAPTLVNLCHHGYFNLDGGPDILSHRMRIDAEDYLPLNALKVPTGEIAPVAGTPFDLRDVTVLGDRMAEAGIAFDHNFCLSGSRVDLRPVAWAESPSSGVRLEVLTTEPGVQLFCAMGMTIGVPGLGGRDYGLAAGFCLETQIWPDAINHPGFPDLVLRPGEVRRQATVYRFSL